MEPATEDLASWRALAQRQAVDIYSFLPNLIRIILRSPALARAHNGALAALRHGSLTIAEQEAVMLSVAAYHDAPYCAALHRTLAAAAGVAQDEIDRLTYLEPPRMPRLRALAGCARMLLETDGLINRQQLASFHRQGVESSQILEIVGLISVTLTEVFIDRTRSPELDEQIVSQAVALRHGMPGSAWRYDPE